MARLAPLALVVIAAVLIVATGIGRELSFASLIRHRAMINAFIADRPLAAFTSFVALYICVVSLSIPGGTVLTVSGGLLFGPFVGALGAYIGAMAGASLIFLIARSALGGWLIKRAGPFAEKFAAGFRRGAFSYLLLLRLVPLFPFWLVNIAPALFGVSFAVFLGATAIGIVPLTFAYALFGAGLDSAVAAHMSANQACLAAGGERCEIDFDVWRALTPELITALVAVTLLALAPVVVRWWRSKRETAKDVTAKDV